jgi:[FeFe] hydrogenase H-cluster maturation GTPase HydF
MRLQIAVAGRTNSGKSSFMNLIAGQDVAITSPIPGTTTDVVEKPMELRPLGPVLFLDTAGIDDDTVLGNRRVERSIRAFDRADVILLITEADVWGSAETRLLAAAKDRKVNLIAVINKIDQVAPTKEFIAELKEATGFDPICVSSVGKDAERERVLPLLKDALLAACPDDFLEPPPLLGDLVKPGQTVILIVPVDIQAPKGRLILPQVQAVRDALDSDALCYVVKESDYPKALANLREKPALAVCDSQVVDLMVRETPPDVVCTTFSILFARLKGDMAILAAGAGKIRSLKPGDKIFIAEACTHHSSEDDIGRVKIPRWLAKKVGGELDVTVGAGRDYPGDLSDYKLVIHCGSCMLNRRETLRRIETARRSGVPITNYGMAISACHGVLERVLSPFPEAMEAFRNA